MKQYAFPALSSTLSASAPRLRIGRSTGSASDARACVSKHRHPASLSSSWPGGVLADAQAARIRPASQPGVRNRSAARLLQGRRTLRNRRRHLYAAGRLQLRRDRYRVLVWTGFSRPAHGQRRLYDMNQVTAAHKTLPLPSLVKVTNLDNGRQMWSGSTTAALMRAVDHRYVRRSAQLLGFEKVGTAKVRVQIMAHESQVLAEAAKQGVLAVDIAHRPRSAAALAADHTQLYALRPRSPPICRRHRNTAATSRNRSIATRKSLRSLCHRPIAAGAGCTADAARRRCRRRKIDDGTRKPGKHLKGQDIGGLYLPSPWLPPINR